MRFCALLVASTVGVLSFARVASADTCAPKTTCSGYAGYYAPSEDLARMTAVTEPILRELRTCLDGLGGQGVTPAVVMRWNTEGAPVEVRIDAPGYNGAPCVARAAAKLSSLQNPRETSIRCAFGCPTAPAEAPPAGAASPPVIIVAPAEAPPAAEQPAVQPTPLPPPIPEPRRERYEKVWYGWQTLLADGISGTSAIVGLASGATGLASAGVAGLYLGTPIVHMANGNVGQGFGSLGIRLLLPPIAFGVGALSGLIVGGTSGSGAYSRLVDGASGAVVGSAVGGLIGVLGCSAIDAAALAYKKERVDEGVTGARGPTAPLWTVAPTFDVGQERATVGVAGQF